MSYHGMGAAPAPECPTNCSPRRNPDGTFGPGCVCAAYGLPPSTTAEIQRRQSEALATRARGQACLDAGGREFRHRGRSCPEGALFVNQFNMSPPGVRMYDPGSICCEPAASTQLTQPDMPATCVQILRGLSRAEVSSLAARWAGYQRAVAAWRNQPIDPSRVREMGARGPFPVFQGTPAERRCARYAGQWLEQMPERPWYAHPAVMVAGAAIGVITLYSWVTRRPVVSKAGPPLVGGSR